MNKDNRNKAFLAHSGMEAKTSRPGQCCPAMKEYCKMSTFQKSGEQQHVWHARGRLQQGVQ